MERESEGVRKREREIETESDINTTATQKQSTDATTCPPSHRGTVQNSLCLQDVLLNRAESLEMRGRAARKRRITI